MTDTQLDRSHEIRFPLRGGDRLRVLVILHSATLLLDRDRTLQRTALHTIKNQKLRPLTEVAVLVNRLFIG